jgi:hypothetical protein
MKLKEWKFEKYLHATDMKIIVAKAAKRATMEGKETVFYNAGQQMSAERLETFRKKFAWEGEDMLYPNSGKRSPPWEIAFAT